MKVTYYQDVDAAYFYLSESKIVDSEEISPGIVCDFDQDDQVVGIEVLSVKRRTPSEFLELTSRKDFPLSFQQTQELKELFEKLPVFV
ncbi:MAG: DUF2283 domain-containing protein [Chroococcales cyanobacterium]